MLRSFPPGYGTGGDNAEIHRYAPGHVTVDIGFRAEFRRVVNFDLHITFVICFHQFGKLIGGHPEKMRFREGYAADDPILGFRLNTGKKNNTGKENG